MIIRDKPKCLFLFSQTNKNKQTNKKQRLTKKQSKREMSEIENTLKEILKQPSLLQTSLDTTKKDVATTIISDCLPALLTIRKGASFNSIVNLMLVSLRVSISKLKLFYMPTTSNPADFYSRLDF